MFYYFPDPAVLFFRRQVRNSSMTNAEISSRLHSMFEDEDIYDVMGPEDEEDLWKKFPQHSVKENWYFPKFER